jgi:GTP cyclohydrolase IB
MTAPERFTLPDLQSQTDHRNLSIEAVGIKGLRYPVLLRLEGDEVPTVATFSMNVALSPTTRGTHMSRFVELLEARRAALDQRGFERFVRDMLARLGVDRGEIEMRFPWFMRKSAPVSGVQSFMDYEVRWRGAVLAGGEYHFDLHVSVPVTSLCPCSKEISRYGAHNQRSHIDVGVRLTCEMGLRELIGVVERGASCELFGLLKRADEKYVTERAYENPRFVEDLVREVAAALDQDPRVESFVVEAENFESIHNHSAFARLRKRAAPIPGVSDGI